MINIINTKIFKYKAIQKPVITTKLPGIMKEFGNSNGIVYVDNVLYKSIELSNANLIEKEGAKARKFVEK